MANSSSKLSYLLIILDLYYVLLGENRRSNKYIAIAEWFSFFFFTVPLYFCSCFEYHWYTINYTRYKKQPYFNLLHILCIIKIYNCVQVVDGRVCFTAYGDTCGFWQYVSIANCGEYYLYKLYDAPSCYMRYCSRQGLTQSRLFVKLV